ncbi:MAG: zinc ribbon domain-containing protein [Desulfitobacterium hafniense]|nr:zinc ribbon domain-containing protein [Desulfitobacterium hafniense]
MPIYEFRCPNCQTVITKLCKMGETGEKLECSKCSQVGLKKQVSGFASPGVSGGKNCSTGCGGSCSSCH